MSEKTETRRRSPLMGFAMAAMVVFTKSAKIMVALKAVKSTKPLVTLVSMVISAFLYGLWLGPWFAIGLIAMLFIHEMGHVIALRLKGYETSGPVFIPFLGAVIFAPKFADRDTEAYVGFGGPVLGTLGALACLAVWPFFDGKTAEILLLVSYLGVFLNLFNLIPISPLDGGRVTQAVGAWFKYMGLGVLLVFTMIVREPSLLLIWILVLDGFDRLPLWIRPTISGMLATAMLALMLLGFGAKQIWWMILLDAIMAVVFTGLYYARDFDRKEKGIDLEVDTRPSLSMRRRTVWLGYYVALVAITTTALVYQASHLPEAVKKGAEALTTEDPPVPPPSK